MPFDFNTYKTEFQAVGADVDEQLKITNEAIKQIDEQTYTDLGNFHKDITSVINLLTSLRPFVLPDFSVTRDGQRGGVGVSGNQLTPETIETSLVRGQELIEKKDYLLAYGFEIESLVRELISLAKTNLFDSAGKNRTDFFEGEGYNTAGYTGGFTEAQKVYRDYLLDCVDKLSQSNTGIVVYPNPSSGKVTIGCPKYRYDYSNIHSIPLKGFIFINPDGTASSGIGYDFENASYNPKDGLPIIQEVGSKGTSDNLQKHISGYDALGKSIQIQGTEELFKDGAALGTDYVQTELDLSDKPNGVYFINIDGVGFTKVVIQH